MPVLINDLANISHDNAHAAHARDFDVCQRNNDAHVPTALTPM